MGRNLSHGVRRAPQKSQREKVEGLKCGCGKENEKKEQNLWKERKEFVDQLTTRNKDESMYLGEDDWKNHVIYEKE